MLLHFLLLYPFYNLYTVIPFYIEYEISKLYYGPEWTYDTSQFPPAGPFPPADPAHMALFPRTDPACGKGTQSQKN